MYQKRSDNQAISHLAIVRRNGFQSGGSRYSGGLGGGQVSLHRIGRFCDGNGLSHCAVSAAAASQDELEGLEVVGLLRILAAGPALHGVVKYGRP